VASRPALEAAAANDPFAVGMAATLLVGAVAGLVLALAGMLLAALAELRDERGELADLEEQGLRPAALRRLTTLRSVLVLVLALLAGTILGLGLAWFTASTVSVGLDQQPPMPPLVLVVPWLPVAGLAAGLAAAVAGGTLVLGLRRFGERRLLREVEE
jgi:ABC-type antimicrobial peptide transport system permease subunit